MSHDDDDSIESLLSSSAVLMTILTSLVKKCGGEVRITDDELMSVTEYDIMSLYYDKESGEMILKVMSPFSGFGNSDDDDIMVH
jgi:hypothetical protein|tara:strand:- start:361 stop:612 length:252 start_codon:yes stop_codon:yes gene_type:complete